MVLAELPVFALVLFAEFTVPAFAIGAQLAMLALVLLTELAKLHEERC